MKTMVSRGGMRAHNPSTRSSSNSQTSPSHRRGRRRPLLAQVDLVEGGDGKEPTSNPRRLSGEAKKHDRAWVKSQPFRVFLREWVAGFRWVEHLRTEGLRLPDAPNALLWETYTFIHRRLQRSNLKAVQMTSEERDVMRMMLELQSKVSGLRHAFGQEMVFPGSLVQPYVKLVLGTRWPDFVLVGVQVAGMHVPGSKKDSCGLIIEIDGYSHLNPGKEKKDVKLEVNAAELGIAVVRFSNETVVNHPGVVRSFLQKSRPAPPAGSDRVMANIVASTLAVHLSVSELEQVLRERGVLVDLEKAFWRLRSNANLKSPEFTKAITAANALAEVEATEEAEMRLRAKERRRPRARSFQPKIVIRRASQSKRPASTCSAVR
jgi:hypothetical protein